MLDTTLITSLNHRKSPETITTLATLDVTRLNALLTRLSMDMLIHAGESIVRRVGNEELTKIKRRQEANPASILLF
jgi:hypothetical protein